MTRANNFYGSVNISYLRQFVMVQLHTINDFIILKIYTILSSYQYS